VATLERIRVYPVKGLDGVSLEFGTDQVGEEYTGRDDTDAAIGPDGADGGQSLDGRVYVSRVNEAPDGRVVHCDEDGGLYYIEEAPGPAEREAGGLVGILEALRDSIR